MEEQKFDDLDCREFIIGQENGYEVVLYQCEIMRIIKSLEEVNSPMAQKFKRLIFIRDYKEATKTNFQRRVSKKDVCKYILSEKDYQKYKYDKRDFDKDMRGYYGKDV
jgi:hypothetical protein